MSTRFAPNPAFLRTMEAQILRNHKAVGQLASRQARKNVRPGGASGFKTSHGSHGLLGSIGYTVFRQGSVFTTRYGVLQGSPASKYGALHERGGWIYAKPGGALAIPIHKDAKAAKSPLEFDDLVFIDRGSKPPLLVRQVSGGRRKARTDIMYVLQKAVYIPMRPYLRPVLRQKRSDIIRLLTRSPRSMKSEKVPA